MDTAAGPRLQLTIESSSQQLITVQQPLIFMHQGFDKT
jgi:hypothetical protein